MCRRSWIVGSRGNTERMIEKLRPKVGVGHFVRIVMDAFLLSGAQRRTNEFQLKIQILNTKTAE